MTNETANQTKTSRKLAEKSLIALTSRELNIVLDALMANRHLFRRDECKYKKLLKQDEIAPALDDREKRNIKASRDICEQQATEISFLIQEINGQI